MDDLPIRDLGLNQEKFEEVSISMDDLPRTDLGLNQEKFEEIKDGAPLFHCDLFDSEVVHKIAQVFLPGLATACVDNTTGDLFKAPASVVVDMRKEMVDYLTQRSETFIVESVIQEDDPDGETSDHPTDIISDFVDDFASSKRNFFSRVSGWLLSESREDKIDDFVQEMEISGFWLMDRREAVAQNLLKNIDFKNIFHCEMKFDSAEELVEHGNQCNFRSINCMNEGCNASFCVVHLEKHDSVCPFKVLPCEQNCSESIMRHEMDRHCITVCPMKLVNCPFYPVGCQSTIPQCMIKQHGLEFLSSHVLHILQVIHKGESVEDLKHRVGQLEKSSSLSELSKAWDVRSLSLAVKELDAKLGPVEPYIPDKDSEESSNTSNKPEHVQEESETQVQTSQELSGNGSES